MKKYCHILKYLRKKYSYREKMRHQVSNWGVSKKKYSADFLKLSSELAYKMINHHLWAKISNTFLLEKLQNKVSKRGKFGRRNLNLNK